MAFFTPVHASNDPIVYEAEVIVVEEEPTWEDVFVTLPVDLQKTARCESDIDGDGIPNPEAENPYSTASGILQFLDGTYAWVWEETRNTPVDWTLKNDPFIQMEFSMWLYERYHLTHWECYNLNMI